MTAQRACVSWARRPACCGMRCVTGPHSPSPCGRAGGGAPRPPMTSPHPSQHRTTPGVRSRGLRVRRRLGGFRQDQAADRSPAAADAGRRQAGTHPVPYLHQGRCRRDVACGCRRRSADGSRSTTPLCRGTARASTSSHPSRRWHDARALFATVLDLPGGMRIGTIHAFCQSLLRRFPLEAALSPHFQTGRRSRRRGRADRGARETCWRTPVRPPCAPRSRRWRASSRPTSSVAMSTPCRPICRACRARSTWARRWKRRSAAPSASPRRPRPRSSPSAINWQSEPELREAALIVQQLGAKQMRRTRRPDPGLARPGVGRPPANTGSIGATSSSPRKASRARRAASSARRVLDQHPDHAAILPDRVRPHPRSDRRLPGVARCVGIGRADDPRRARCCTPTPRTRRPRACSITTT